MQRSMVAPGTGSGEAPLLVRLGGKLVLEVLPAALASAIGAFLFAQYQFGRGPVSAPAAAPTVVVPASPEMLQMVREEHAIINDLLTAQQAAERHRVIAADAADAQAAADAKVTAEAVLPSDLHRHVDLIAAARPAAARNRAVAIVPGQAASAALPSIVVGAARPSTSTVLVARVDAAPQAPVNTAAPPEAVVWPATPPPVHSSIVAETLAVPGHVVTVTLHAVRAIGSIPSWLGHRFGDGDESVAPLASSTAS